MQTKTSYRHLSPVLLTDEMFFSVLGDSCLYTGTATQRNMAYVAAEQQMEAFMGTPLFSTNITGSYVIPQQTNPITLEHVQVHSIQSVKAYYNTDCQCTLTEMDGCGIILESGYGFIHMQRIYDAILACGRGLSEPLKMEVVYNAGHPSGIMIQDTSLHMALVLAAQQYLNELVNPGALEGGAGAPGIVSYSSLGYSETRNKQGMTPFGQSAIANRIAQIVNHLKKPKRTLGRPRRYGL